LTPPGGTRKSPIPEKVCFVLSPIGDENSPIRKRADNVLDHIIRPAAPGYTVLRADKIEAPGHITMQIVQHILDAPLVVADLTGHNANVFYELELRHVVRKPVIHMIDAEERIPFDVAPQRTIRFDAQDLGSAAAARDELARQTKAVEADPTNLDNPFSIALDVETLRRSDVSSDRMLSRLISVVETTLATVQQLEARFSGPTLGEIRQAMGDLPRFGTRAFFSDVSRASRPPDRYTTDPSPGTVSAETLRTAFSDPGAVTVSPETIRAAFTKPPKK
jgi:hypothetical protein